MLCILQCPCGKCWLQCATVPLVQLNIRDTWSSVPSDLNIQRPHPCPGKLAPLLVPPLPYLLEGMGERVKGQWPLRKAVGRKGQGRQPASFSLKGQLKQYHPYFWLIVGRENVAYKTVESQLKRKDEAGKIHQNMKNNYLWWMGVWGIFIFLLSFTSNYYF